MDDGLKQRMVGAIVLVALGMIFIPMLFDDKTKSSYVESSQIPESPKMPEMATVNQQELAEKIPAVQTAEDHQQAVWEEQDKTDVADEENISPTEAPAAVKTESSAPKVEATLKPAVAIASSGLPETWTLQVGTFGDKTNANALRKQLADKGYQAYVRDIKDEKGVTFKVFVGPDVEKAHAEVIMKKLSTMQKELHITGIILKPYQP